MFISKVLIPLKLLFERKSGLANNTNQCCGQKFTGGLNSQVVANFGIFLYA